MERRRRRSLNLGNLLVLLLTLALGASLWVPYGTARRVARIEAHAPRIARLLLQATRAAMPIDFTDEEAGAAITEDLRQRCRQAHHPESTLPDRIEPPTDADGRPWPAFCFRAKHFLFLVAETPADQAAGGAAPLLEVYAWPRLAGAAHSAFFFGEERGDDGSLHTRALYSRNLDRGYAGRTHAPRPGAARPREGENDGESEGESDKPYYGADNQRWITLPDDDSVD